MAVVEGEEVEGGINGKEKEEEKEEKRRNKQQPPKYGEVVVV